NKNNPMKIDYIKTKEKISKWIKRLPDMIEKESRFIQKERPDVIVSDISVMPLLLARKNHVSSVALSNFVWSDTLDLDARQKEFFEDAYRSADLAIKLPFGSEMKLPNVKEYGLVARNVTKTRNSIRKKLEITKDKKLVTISLGGFKEKIPVKASDSVKILDMSDYSTVMKLKKLVNFVEGQNLINASDLVIAKCGYGITSECLPNEIPFRYVYEPTHREAFGINKGLAKLKMNNTLSLEELLNVTIDDNFIKNTKSMKMKTSNQKVAQAIMTIAG
ncbi:MAG: hypothetical protein KGL95_12870, partial [Patescibacteria group bacterium]|nr:hypothetical protein [Patescibacteria group bacterium]